jgi:hypothetical protein
VPPVGRIKAIFQPIFQVSVFSCFSPDFAGAVSARSGDEIGETKEVFAPYKLIYNNLLHFYTGVTIEEKHMSELTPFLQQFGQSFMADSSKIFGDLFLFLAEVVEFDLLSLGEFVLYSVTSQMYKGDFGKRRKSHPVNVLTEFQVTVCKVIQDQLFRIHVVSEMVKFSPIFLCNFSVVYLSLYF